jgi:hypothetical protein
MTKIAIMQPYMFPYIGYFQLINAVDTFVLLDSVTFIKKGWINRNRILSSNGPLTFSIPLSKPSQNKLIRDTYLHNEYRQWSKKFLKTIRQSYSKAPNFEEVYGLVESGLVGDNLISVSELCRRSLSLVCEFLGITTEISSSSLYDTGGLKAEDRIIKICELSDAEHYINLSGGKSLYSFSNFQEKGLTLSFISSKDIAYKQYKEPHEAWLSIIDILMFNSVEEVKKMLENTNIEVENV